MQILIKKIRENRGNGWAYAPKESRQSNWGLAQARAVIGVLEEKQLEPELLKKGQAISLSLGLDDIKLAQENVPKISMVGWENLETALQAYIKNNPEHGVRNLDDLRVATLTAIYSIEGLENPVHWANSTPSPYTR